MSLNRKRISRRRFLRRVGMGMGGALAVGVPSLASLATGPRASASESGSRPTRARRHVGLPPLPDQIRSMIMAPINGTEPDPTGPTMSSVEAGSFGGVILFGRNIASPAGARSLTRNLAACSPTPLLVAADQEGGLVARLNSRNGFPPTVAPVHLGRVDDTTLTYHITLRSVNALQSAGVNLNLAPVVDVAVNPDNPVIAGLDRAFSADPAQVTRHARAFIWAHHSRRIHCTLKHFPGHGSSLDDSHLGFVDVTNTWSEAELEPFATLIDEGLANVVMTAHIFNANLDPHLPATLSRPTITGLLRERLGYDGVVISDAMEMQAITDNYGFEESVRLAIEAGVDILLFSDPTRLTGSEGAVEHVTERDTPTTALAGERDVAELAAELITGFVEAGVFSEERIARSYLRIQRLKERWLAPG